MKPLVVAAWAFFICVGLYTLYSYQSRPGAKGRAPVVWPQGVTIVPAQGRFNLVLSLHPHCPCSTATVEELDKILAHTGSSMHVHVLLFAPANAAENWTRSTSTSAVAQFPNTTVTLDPDGALSEKFGALTSGDTHLFAPNGRLIFHGGITSSRGHVGDNAGSTVIMELVRGDSCALEETPVFGCGIQSPQSLMSTSTDGKETRK